MKSLGVFTGTEDAGALYEKVVRGIAPPSMVRLIKFLDSEITRVYTKDTLYQTQIICNMILSNDLIEELTYISELKSIAGVYRDGSRLVTAKFASFLSQLINCITMTDIVLTMEADSKQGKLDAISYFENVRRHMSQLIKLDDRFDKEHCKQDWAILGIVNEGDEEFFAPYAIAADKHMKLHTYPFDNDYFSDNVALVANAISKDSDMLYYSFNRREINESVLPLMLELSKDNDSDIKALNAEEALQTEAEFAVSGSTDRESSSEVLLSRVNFSKDWVKYIKSDEFEDLVGSIKGTIVKVTGESLWDAF